MNRPDKFHFYRDARKEWRWTLKAPNGEVIGASTEGYKRKKDCVSNAERLGYVKVVKIEEVV